MKKRIMIAVALVLALVLIAQTGVWAGKLAAGNQAPPSASDGLAARPAGTNGSDYVPPTEPPYIPPPPDGGGGPPTGDDDTEVTVYLGTPPGEPPEGASFYEILCEGGEGEILATPCTINLEGGEEAWYWDGEAWIELEVSDTGEVVIPAGKPNPFILAVV